MIESLPSPAPEIVFSTSSLLGWFLTGLLGVMLPLAACYLMFRFRALRMFPLTAGAVTYFLATRFNDLTVNLLFFSAPPASRALFAAVTVCIFEEAGRYLTMRFPLADVHSSAAAVCYGIGHGGLECIIRGIQSFRVYGYGTTYNSEGLSYFTDGKSAERAEQIITNLQGYAERGLPLSLMHILNAGGNLCFHIALSVLIYKKIQYGQGLQGLMIAILLHDAINELYNIAGVTGGDWAAVSTGLLCAAGITVLVCKLIGGHSVIGEITDEQYAISEE